MNNPPKRISIIGPPGSGKTTLALRLSKKFGLPIYHLDLMIFGEKDKKRGREEYLELHHDTINLDKWILDGTGTSCLGSRCERSDLVIYLKLSRVECIYRLIQRLFKADKTLAKSGHIQFLNWFIVRFIWNFYKNKEAKLQEIKRSHPEIPFQTIRNQKELDTYIESL